MTTFIRKYWQHLAFWGIAFLLSFAWIWWITNFTHALIRSISNGFFVISIFYINANVLVPRLFTRKLYFFYIIVSILFLIAYTTIRYYFDIVFLPPFSRFNLYNDSYENRVFYYYWAATNFHFYISLVYSLNLDLAKEKKQNAELERQRLDAELKFLKSQLRPHFLLNTLNNIYTLSYLKNPLATPMLMKLSESMKYLLYEGDSEYVALQEEVNFIENYVELNKLRLDKPERIQFTYAGIASHQKIQPMLFLTFIENAFKHSDTEENETGFVYIALKVTDMHQILFTCENTVRQSKTNLLEKSGIGLQNVKQRLDILFGNNYKLYTEELNNIFKVHLTINTIL